MRPMKFFLIFVFVFGSLQSPEKKKNGRFRILMKLGFAVAVM